MKQARLKFCKPRWPGTLARLAGAILCPTVQLTASAQLPPCSRGQMLAVTACQAALGSGLLHVTADLMEFDLDSVPVDSKRPPLASRMVYS